MIKEKIIGALDLMSEKDAEKFWILLQQNFVIRPKTWDDIEEVEPTTEELEIIHAYKNGDEHYQPLISQEDLSKELGIDL